MWLKLLWFTMNHWYIIGIEARRKIWNKAIYVRETDKDVDVERQFDFLHENQSRNRRFAQSSKCRSIKGSDMLLLCKAKNGKKKMQQVNFIVHFRREMSTFKGGSSKARVGGVGGCGCFHFCDAVVRIGDACHTGCRTNYMQCRPKPSPACAARAGPTISSRSRAGRG